MELSLKHNILLIYSLDICLIILRMLISKKIQLKVIRTFILIYLFVIM